MRALVFQILWPLLVCLVGASPVPEIHRKHREIQNPTQIRERDYAKASKAPALEEFGSFGSVTLSASAPQEPLTNKNSPLQHEAKDMVQSPSSQDNSKSLADPFSGFFFDMQDMMKLLKEQMTEVLSRVPQDSSIVRENLVGPQDIKNQSSTKVDYIDGHKVIINDTTYSNGETNHGSIFHVQILDVSPWERRRDGVESFNPGVSRGRSGDSGSRGGKLNRDESEEGEGDKPEAEEKDVDLEDDEEPVFNIRKSQTDKKNKEKERSREQEKTKQTEREREFKGIKDFKEEKELKKSKENKKESEPVKYDSRKEEKVKEDQKEKPSQKVKPLPKAKEVEEEIDYDVEKEEEEIGEDDKEELGEKDDEKFQVRDKSPPRSVVNLMVKPGKISREEENENLIREYSNNLREEFDMNSNYGTVKLVIQKPIRSSMPEFDEESLEDVIKDSKKVPSKDLNKVEPRYSSLRQYENTLWDPVNSSKKSGSISTVNEYHQDVTANSERKSSNEDLMETSESRWNEQLDNRIDNYQPYYNYPMNYYANQLQYNRYPNYREAYYGNIPPSYNNYQPIYNGGYDRYVDLSGDTKVNDYMADQQQAGLISIDPDAELIDINKKPVQNAHLPKYRYSRL